MKQIIQTVKDKFYEDEELLSKYKETKDINIRNKIVKKYMHVAEYIADKYAEKNNSNKEDLYSYAYEGLILSIDEYNETIKSNFFKYIFCRVFQFLDIGLVESESSIYMRADRYKILKQVIKEIEIENKDNFYDNYYLLDKIIDKLPIEKFYKKNSENNTKKYLSLYNLLYLDEQNLDILYENNNIDAINNLVREVLITEINKLRKKEKDILNYYYGFYDGNCYTLEEISKILNLPLNSVCGIKRNACKKLKLFDEVRKLFGILNLYNKTDDKSYRLIKKSNEE